MILSLSKSINGSFFMFLCVSISSLLMMYNDGIKNSISSSQTYTQQQRANTTMEISQKIKMEFCQLIAIIYF